LNFFLKWEGDLYSEYHSSSLWSSPKSALFFQYLLAADFSFDVFFFAASSLAAAEAAKPAEAAEPAEAATDQRYMTLQFSASL
jgi:hypothetical protein